MSAGQDRDEPFLIGGMPARKELEREAGDGLYVDALKCFTTTRMWHHLFPHAITNQDSRN